MSDIKDFLQPVNEEVLPQVFSSKSWLKSAQIYIYDFPETEGAQLAFFGLNDGAMDGVRHELYKLVQHYQMKVVDLGNIKRGASQEDTGFAITQVCKQLLEDRVIPVFIAEDAHWGYYFYKAYEDYGSYISLSYLSSNIHLWDEQGNGTLLNGIFSYRPNFLFNFSAIGYQSYFTESETVQSLQKMYFDTYRLGWVNQNIEETEPLFRSSDVMMTDMNALRTSDFPAQADGSPNGFFGDEICRLVRYAGMSSKMNGWFVNGFQSSHTLASNSAKLLAQMIWYFADGMMARQPENPEESPEGFMKYVVGLKDNAHEIIFYKSLRTDKWWMEIPNPMNKAMHHGPVVVPCSYQDYIKASNEEIPERWWNIYQKLM